MIYEVFREEFEGLPDEQKLSPCDQAYWTSCLRKDEKDIKNPAEMFNNGDTSWWYNSGKHHRVTKDGFILREFLIKGWFVTLNSLKELSEFMRRNGPIRMEKDLFHKEYTITILNTYKNPHKEMAQMEMVE